MVPIPKLAPCDVYRAGHAVHWIQARLTWKEPREQVDVVIVELDEQTRTLTVLEGGQERRYLNHDVPRLVALVNAVGPVGTLLGYSVLRLAEGYMVSVQADDGSPLGPCAVRPRRSGRDPIS